MSAVVRGSVKKDKKEKDEIESHQRMEEKQRSGGFFYLKKLVKKPIL
jgi:hypothetical protein